MRGVGWVRQKVQIEQKERKVYKMILSLSCLVTQRKHHPKGKRKVGKDGSK